MKNVLRARREEAGPHWRTLRDDGCTSPADLLYMLELRMPPVDVEYIARTLGVFVRYVRSDEWAGILDTRSGEAVVQVNISDHPHHRRFMIAHELGHLLLHPVDRAYGDAKHAAMSGDRLEKEANRFAAELLVPSSMLRYAMQSTSGDARRLSVLFNVSEETISYRLDGMHLE